MITSIKDWSMSQLQYAVMFGIGAAVLYIAVPAVILFIESKHAKTSEYQAGMGNLMAALGRGAILIVGWLLFATIVIFLLIGATQGASGNETPSYGIWAFWNVDWINPSVLSSLDTTSTIYSEGGDEALAFARTLAFAMTFAKYLEIFFLGVIMITLTVFVGWAHLGASSGYRGMGGFDHFTFGDVLSIILVFMVSIVVFTMILQLMNNLLVSILEFAGKIGQTVPSTDLNILDDLWRLFRLGASKFEA